MRRWTGVLLVSTLPIPREKTEPTRLHLPVSLKNRPNLAVILNALAVRAAGPPTDNPSTPTSSPAAPLVRDLALADVDRGNNDLAYSWCDDTGTGKAADGKTVCLARNTSGHVKKGAGPWTLSALKADVTKANAIPSYTVSRYTLKFDTCRQKT